MRRSPAFGGVARGTAEGAKPVACLAFVAVLALAFWAGALWIGNFIMQLLA
jgi:hypothetical protein